MTDIEIRKLNILRRMLELGSQHAKDELDFLKIVKASKEDFKSVQIYDKFFILCVKMIDDLIKGEPKENKKNEHCED